MWRAAPATSPSASPGPAGPARASPLPTSRPRWWPRAQARASAEGLDRRNADFTVGNAEALAFPDKSFDAYTIAFGIRNVTHIDKALAEAYRVLKPGGHFLCLEFSHVDVPGLDRAL